MEGALGNRGLAVPFAYAVARTDQGAPVVVAGTDMERVRKLDAWWSVTAWPSAANSALIGTRAASVVSPDNQPFTLRFEGRKLELTPAGTLRTGAAEDSRVYLGLKEFTAWTGVQASSIEIGASGTPDEINGIISQLAQALPAAEVKPVRQIVEGEARVLGKTRAALLAAVAMIILTAALCVLATLTAWVLDRRRDFAIMKALGASERVVNGFFAAEAAALGAVGAVIGFAIGIGVAAWIGRVNFHAAVVPRFGVFPVVFAGSVAVALISAVLPIGLLRRVQPATILRGE
ncbi:MAG: ABC transporter permease [Acidobacteriia bacterium]|nr:ABC transporter permease [Terriglobia bacterium]